MADRGQYRENETGGSAGQFRYVVIVLLLGGLCMDCKRHAPARIATSAKSPTATSAKQTGPFSPDQIEPRIFEIVAEQMGVRKAELTRTLRLKEDLKADDLDRVELTMELEDTFHLSITDEIADRWKTIGDLSDFVRANYKP